MILMFGSVLAARSASTIKSYDFGYQTGGLREFQVNAEVTRDSARIVAASAGRAAYGIGTIVPEALEDITTRIRQLPNVSSAAWYVYADVPAATSDELTSIRGVLTGTTSLNVGAGFFDVLGIPILEGRGFVETDRERGAVILDPLSAAALFPGGKAIGKLVRYGTGAWMPVIGIAKNIVHDLPDDPAVERRPTIYFSRSPEGAYYLGIVARGKSGAKDISPAVAEVIRTLTPQGTPFSARNWNARFDQFLAVRRFAAGLFLALSFASIVLASAGLFGVMSYAVNRRMREFAVRVALGATRRNVVRLVVHDGLTMVLGATAIGGFIAMYGAFTLWDWLWGVYPVDAPALIISEGTLIGITLVAAILPALRATKANPVDVMRAT
jgi:ABC-type antimicrobial peptide transport system permease subunit